ncbi:MAG: DUF4097 domain-containing protein [Bifidobacteriaceae bacterium]|jgi:hypothetical protein|nr:DUF4097 domain-containing protein [Bifidobacteriaceae bacterium]
MGELMTSYPTNGPIAVSVDASARCDVWITAADLPEASVDVRPRSAQRTRDLRAAELTQASCQDGRLAVSLRPPRRHALFTDGGAVDLVIQVPTGSSLALRTGMGDLTCGGQFGPATLITGMGGIRMDRCGALKAKTGHGDLSVEWAAGPVDLTTGSGDLRAGQIDAAAAIRNSNGPIDLGLVGGDLRAKTGNGRIAVRQAEADVTAKSAAGAVTLERVSRGTITALTSAGGIRIGVADGAAAWLDLHTSYGAVSSELEPAGDPGQPARTVKIHARTAAGDIAITRVR